VSSNSDPRRKWPRLHHEVLVAVSSKTHGAFTGWSTSISAGGCFVNSPHAPPVGNLVSILLQLPGQPECKLNGRVIWSQSAAPGVDDPGMGIEFIDADDRTKAQLARVVQQLTKDLSKPS
jgi:uncharacterized protein (TIGR02266 family)